MNGTDSIVIRDEATGGRASIAVARGMNCYSWLPRGEGESDEVLWAEPGFAGGAGRPSGSGIPILFPFPGRIGGGRFTWQGRTFELPEGDGRGNALHGFVLDRPWRVSSREEACVTSTFRASRDLEGWDSLWPADFELTCRYEIGPNTLSCTITVANPSSSVLPCGLGLHPYFRLEADHPDARLELPVTKEYELEGLIPTGVQRRLSDASDRGVQWPLAARSWDNVYGNLGGADDRNSAVAVDGARGRRVTISWDRRCFPYTVVYTPGHRKAVCIEPYSTLPDAFALEAKGIPSGRWSIEPGASIEATVTLSVAAM